MQAPDLGPASNVHAPGSREHGVEFTLGDTDAMRGREQHIERKIRLWVVQQERDRLRESPADRLDTQIGKRAETRPEQDGRIRQ
jgi:hypothetical protein